MNSRKRKISKRRAAWILACACVSVAFAFPQVEKNRLAPENANEARLNGLQPPDKVMDIIGLAAGMRIAEIGAGRGRYVVHLADRVGPEGRVYAQDIDAEALRHCAERCRRCGFNNVETILGDQTDPAHARCRRGAAHRPPGWGAGPP